MDSATYVDLSNKCQGWEKLEVVCSKEDFDDSSPQTPNEVVFDPVAPPGLDNMAMASLCKKYFDQIRTSAARRLKFESSFNSMENKTCIDGAKSISDEELFEFVYNDLLEAIVSKQTEDLLAEISNTEWDSDCCKTPPAPHLNGIAETSPGAPVKKPSAKSRKIDLGLGRKLEF
ncbi:unknown protein 1-like [Mangifera indica]|uniref:unknown protein 1-like n=1 Tax=Mangifera indica TaxID=29780 RepID=UPI001CFA3AD8|nr:unknown protein 1-like [Mangifera indica]